MSIEELFKAVIVALEANTKAVVALEASLQGRTPSKSAEKPAEAEEKKPEEKKPEDVKVKQAAESKKDPVEVADANNENNAKHPEDLAAAAAVPYETVRALVLKLAPTQREAIKALNANHGIANLKVLLDKEDDFSTVNDQAKLEAVYADLQALEG